MESVTPPGQNFCLKLKHLKDSYLVGLCGLNLLTHERLDIRLRKDLAPNHVKRLRSALGKPIMQLECIYAYNYMYYHVSQIFKESGEYVAICGSAKARQPHS